jgi:DNA repair exonuclease SbcCD ATPase subunit
MIKVKKIRIENLGRFVGSHIIDFESKSNFIQVDAENRNTGGSSGGGKSSIFLALEYVLGLNDVPSTVLQSRLTKSSMSVEAEIDKDGQSFTISRNKSGGLSISSSSLNVSGSTKEAEDTLDRILGIPRSLLRPMFHKRQGEGGFFLSKTPKQSHDFLMECLGMNSLEEKISKIESRLKVVEQVLTTKKSELSAQKIALESTEALIQSLAPPKCDIDERVLITLMDRINFVKQQKDLSVKEMETKIQSTGEVPSFSYMEDSRLTEAIAGSQRNAQILFSKITEASNIASSLSSSIRSDQNNADLMVRAISGKGDIEKELEELKVQITEAMKKICPTCKQGLHTDHLSQSVATPLIAKAQKRKAELDAIAVMEEKLPTVQEAIVANQNALADLEKGKLELEAKLTKEKNDLAILTSARDTAKDKAMLEYKAIVDMINQSKKKIIDDYTPILNQLEAQLDAYNQAYYKGQANLKSFQESLARYEVQKKTSEAQLGSLKESVSSAGTEVDRLTKEFSVGSASLKFVKSYANQLFQESLVIVADTATKILSRIPNMNTATITFDAYKETKSGALKEEVVAILSLDDEVNVPVKSMSGGERAAVDLAVDLAVIDMIEARTGNGLDLFVLDEPFDGLDAICRENCLEVLRNHASNRKIVIVDHSTETKQMVQDKILIVREGQTSRVDDSM